MDVLGLEGSTYANAREMTDKEIGRFFGDEKWHDTSAKPDFYINKDTNDVYLKTNEKEIWINTGDKLE